MTVTITFNMPDEEAELKTYLRVYDYYAALFDMGNYLRSLEKSGLNPPVHEIRDHFLGLAGPLIN